MIFLVIIYLGLLVLGAKATWKLVVNISPVITDGSLLLAVVIFVLLFLIIGPIMGIVTGVKLIIAKANAPKNITGSNTPPE